MNGNILITNWQEAFLLAISSTVTNMLSFLPVLLAALIIFFVGLILAKAAKSITIKILEGIRLSQIIKKTGFEPFLKKAEIKLKIEEIFGGVVKWIIILIFFITAVNVLGLTTVSQVLNNILAYIPKVVSAILILTIGVLLAGVVESLVKGALSQVDLKIARFLAKLSSYIVVIFSSLAALNELQIAQTLINTLLIGFVAMLSLGLGLAIGLGAKDLIAKILNQWYDNFRKEIKRK